LVRLAVPKLSFYRRNADQRKFNRTVIRMAAGTLDELGFRLKEVEESSASAEDLSAGGKTEQLICLFEEALAWRAGRLADGPSNWPAV